MYDHRGHNKSSYRIVNSTKVWQMVFGSRWCLVTKWWCQAKVMRRCLQSSRNVWRMPLPLRRMHRWTTSGSHSRLLGAFQQGRWWTVLKGPRNRLNACFELGAFWFPCINFALQLFNIYKDPSRGMGKWLVHTPNKRGRGSEYRYCKIRKELLI